MSPSGANAWKSTSNGDLQWTGRAVNGRAFVKGANLPLVGTITAAVNLSFPSDVSDAGPTSILLRFDSKDQHIGPNADEWKGYECAIQPGRLSLGYHDHDYSALNATVAVSAAAAGKSLLFGLKLVATASELHFTYSIDGELVATYVESDKTRIGMVQGSGIALRGFHGLATFHSLTFSSSPAVV